MSGNWHKQGNIRGKDGVGVPTGGQTGQSLQKVGNSDFATAWAFPEYKDIVGKVPKEALPDIGNSTVPVESEAAMLNLPAVVGNMAIRTDIGKTFVLAEEPATDLSNWVELVTESDVQSVNGQTGNVNLTKADVGLGNVNNTADADKPLATSSVNGLMPKGDKAKLDNATSAATASRVAIRDSAGRISFKQVTLSEAPSAAGHTTTKSYVDDGLAGRLKIDTWLAAEDANTITTPGAYGKVGSSDISNPSLHYPEGSMGAGVLLVTRYSSGGLIQEWTSWGSGSASRNRRWIRNSNDTGATWTDWKEMASISDVVAEVAAGVKPAEFQLNELQGGHVLTQNIPSGVGWTSGVMSYDWDYKRAYAQTGVVEGWAKGCPVGGAIDTTYNMSAGFVMDPVWKLEVRPEGLGYVTQRATLLNCAPKFMIGFSWERVYNPATSKWSAWNCVGGDSGPIYAQIGGLISNTTIENPLRSVGNSSVYLYNDSEPLIAHRTGGQMRFFGAMSTTKLDDLVSTNTTTNPTIAYFADSASGLGTGKPGMDYTLGMGPAKMQFPVQTGSYRNHWLCGPASKDGVALAFVASRYGPNTASAPPWLPFNVMWPVPGMNTYTGAGYLPPAIPPQSGTNPT